MIFWKFSRRFLSITLRDDLTISFKTAFFGKGHYRCEHGADRYDIYKQIGRKCSIYCNDRQIALLDKKMVTWFNGENYIIVALNIDLGRNGSEAKRFDEYCVPAE
jgi:hypothetical protein